MGFPPSGFKNLLSGRGEARLQSEDINWVSIHDLEWLDSAEFAAVTPYYYSTYEGELGKMVLI